MKKETIGEKTIEDVLDQLEKKEVQQTARVRIQHFVIKDGVMIPWDIAMDRVKEIAFVENLRGREQADIDRLENELERRQVMQRKRYRTDFIASTMVILFFAILVVIFKSMAS